MMCLFKGKLAEIQFYSFFVVHARKGDDNLLRMYWILSPAAGEPAQSM